MDTNIENKQQVQGIGRKPKPKSESQKTDDKPKEDKPKE